MSAHRPNPLRLLLGSFLALIGIGTALLLLPAATPFGRPLGLVDALFTATSAACVTGLVVRDTGLEFTPFGQLVILGLIQLGGIGIMTFSLLIFSLLGRRVSLSSRALLSHTLAGSGEWAELLPLLRVVVRFTLATEAIGALLLTAHWHGQLGLPRAAWAAVFHSVSAFCNAGFSLWSTSLTAYREDAFVNLVIATLIILGGLGFLTVYELQESRKGARLSLHSRLVLVVSAALVVGGTLLVWIFEHHRSLAGLSAPSQLLAAFFQSVSSRTAGFNTLPIGSLAPGTLFVLALLMFIGGSPGSCAGGIKTTTFGVLVLAAWNRLRKRRHVNAFHRTLPLQTLENTLTITMGAAFVALAGLLALLFLEAPRTPASQAHGLFLAYFFETVSALGTVGLSTGITAGLLPSSRLLLTALMFVGRMGPLTVAASLAREDPTTDWRYAEEDVMVG